MSLEEALNRHSDLMERFLTVFERFVDLQSATKNPREQTSAPEPAKVEEVKPESQQAKGDGSSSTRDAFRQFAPPPEAAKPAEPVKRGPGRPRNASVTAARAAVRSPMEPDDTPPTVAGDVSETIEGRAPAARLPDLVEDELDHIAPVDGPHEAAIAAWAQNTPERVAFERIVALHEDDVDHEQAREVLTAYMGPEGSAGRDARLKNIGLAIQAVEKRTGVRPKNFADVPHVQVRTVIDELGITLGVYTRTTPSVDPAQGSPF